MTFHGGVAVTGPMLPAADVGSALNKKRAACKAGGSDIA